MCKQKKQINKLDSGFSLIELIVVMAIIGILTLLATPMLDARKEEANVRALQQDIKVLSDASSNFFVEKDEYPANNDALVGADKLIRALDGANIDDFKALDEDKVSEVVSSTKNGLNEYILATKGKYRGQVFHLKGIPGKDGKDYHGSAGGTDVVSTPPIEYDHSELYNYISEVRNSKVNGRYEFSDDDMYEFKNAERQIGEGDDAKSLQEQFNAVKKDIYVAANSTELLAGDSKAGYYGLVDAKELFTGSELAREIGLTAGQEQNSTVPWLKFASNGKTIYKPMKSIRSNISWDHIDAVGAVFGSAKVKKNGTTYSVRLMRGASSNPSKDEEADRGAHGSEWNRLMLPITINAKDNSWGSYGKYVEKDVAYWGIGFTDADLGHKSANGRLHWTQEVAGSNSGSRVHRGYNGVADSNSSGTGLTDVSYGWAPVLEVLPDAGS